MLNAVASQETAGFPADALFKKRGRRRKDVVKSFAVRGGLGPAVQALAALPGIRCAVDREAAEVARAGDGFTVRTVQGDLIHARRVAVAAPADAASRMLAAGFPGLSAQLAKIETRTVKSLGVVFDDPLPRLPRLTGLVLPEGPCYSALSADTFPVPGKRAWAFHFDGARAGTEQEMLACACQVLGAAPAAVAATFRRDHSMPSIAMGHGDWLAEVDRSLPATGLLLVGNYLSGLSIEDCAGRARREFDRVLG
jgi:oxygen-dependent protoporphyrinogen oxidase